MKNISGRDKVDGIEFWIIKAPNNFSKLAQ